MTVPVAQPLGLEKIFCLQNIINTARMRTNNLRDREYFYHEVTHQTAWTPEELQDQESSEQRCTLHTTVSDAAQNTATRRASATKVMNPAEDLEEQQSLPKNSSCYPTSFGVSSDNDQRRLGEQEFSIEYLGLNKLPTGDGPGSPGDSCKNTTCSTDLVPSAVRLRASVRKLGSSPGLCTWRERFLVLTGEKILSYHTEQEHNLELNQGDSGKVLALLDQIQSCDTVNSEDRERTSMSQQYRASSRGRPHEIYLVMEGGVSSRKSSLSRLFKDSSSSRSSKSSSHGSDRKNNSTVGNGPVSVMSPSYE